MSTQDERDFVQGITTSLACSREMIDRTGVVHQTRTSAAVQRATLLDERRRQQIDGMTIRRIAEQKEAGLLATVEEVTLGNALTCEAVQKMMDSSRLHASSKRKADEMVAGTTTLMEDLQSKKRMLDREIESAIAKSLSAKKAAADAKLLSDKADVAAAEASTAAEESMRRRNAADEAYATCKLESVAVDWTARDSSLTAEITLLTRVDAEESERDVEAGRQHQDATNHLDGLHMSLIEISSAISGACVLASIAIPVSSMLPGGPSVVLDAPTPRPGSLSAAGIDEHMFDDIPLTPTTHHTSPSPVQVDPFGGNLLEDDNDELLNIQNEGDGDLGSAPGEA